MRSGPGSDVKVLGISALDRDTTASLVEDGLVLFAAGEERFSRRKLHSGFPWQAIGAALETTGTDPADIALVTYPFLTWDQETELIRRALAEEAKFQQRFREPNLQRALAEAEKRVPRRLNPIHGLESPDQRMVKEWWKQLVYRVAGGDGTVSRRAALRASRQWGQRASAEHRHWQQELEAGLAKLGLLAKLERSEHHLSHAANAYLASGFGRALVVTADGYGSGLAGSISLGENGTLRRLHNLRFPHSLGAFYQAGTSSLGFDPDRHAGKTVGLATSCWRASSKCQATSGSSTT
jgi:carbamoyltransferase